MLTRLLGVALAAIAGQFVGDSVEAFLAAEVKNEHEFDESRKTATDPSDQ